MNIRTLKYILSLVFFLFVVDISAQVEIKKSTEKVKIGDEIFYIHLVKQGETIYSLCRVYNISQDELVKINPQLSGGLKADQRLKIPEKSTVVVDTKPAKAEIQPTKQEPKIQDIVQSQPSKTENIVESETALSLTKHKIKKNDDLESIAKQYNCTVDDILKYNTLIDKNSKLKVGQYITIPPKQTEKPLIQTEEKKVTTETNKIEDKIDNSTKDIDTIKSANCKKCEYDGKSLNVLLLLPLKVANINNPGKNNQSDYNFIEFYEGFLLALDSLKDAGVSVNLTTEDVYDKKTLNDLLNSDVFDNKQLIIGPVHSDLMDTVAKVAAKLKIPVISPLDPKTEGIANNNKYFIQVATPASLQTQKLELNLCEEGENIILFYDKIIDTVGFDKTIKTLTDCKKKPKKYKYVMLKWNDNDLKNLFDKNKKNNVFVLSNDDIFVTDVLSKINALSLSQRYSVIVYGSSHWKTIKNLNYEHIYNLNLVVSQLFYVDYNRDEVKKFIEKYRYYYKGDPTAFSFHGYDLGVFIVEKLAKYGENIVQCLTTEESETFLQTRFKFKKASPNGGLINSEAFLLKHKPDMNIEVH